MRSTDKARITATAVEKTPIDFPVELTAELKGISALTRNGDRVEVSETNRFAIEVRRDYPFMKPGIRWLTNIYHPNIAPPAEGGVVCTRLLQEWRADRTLLSLVEGIANLVENPNLDEPLNFDSCMEACNYLRVKGAGH